MSESSLSRRSFVARSLATVGVIAFGRPSPAPAAVETETVAAVVTAPARAVRLRSLGYMAPPNPSGTPLVVRAMRGATTIWSAMVPPDSILDYRFPDWDVADFDRVTASTLEGEELSSFDLAAADRIEVSTGSIRAANVDATLFVEWEE